MTNPDHLVVTGAFQQAVAQVGRRGFYLEQPYDWWWARPARRLTLRTRWRQSPPDAVESPVGIELRWTPLETSPVDIARKFRACRRYGSQLPLFGRGAVLRILLREARRGGEHVAWV